VNDLLTEEVEQCFDHLTGDEVEDPDKHAYDDDAGDNNLSAIDVADDDLPF